MLEPEYLRTECLVHKAERRISQAHCQKTRLSQSLSMEIVVANTLSPNHRHKSTGLGENTPSKYQRATQGDGMRSEPGRAAPNLNYLKYSFSESILAMVPAFELPPANP